MTTVTYYNGRRYVRTVRKMDLSPLHYLLTFAYRGTPQEWPVITGYRIF